MVGLENLWHGSWHDSTTGSSGSHYRIHITGAGWVLYEREWAHYREHYPGVDALTRNESVQTSESARERLQAEKRVYEVT